MTEAMSVIDDIRKEVFEFLMERHYRAKERGEEFYFTIQTIMVKQLPDSFKQELSVEKIVKISFYNLIPEKQIAYLIITELEKVYLAIELHAENQLEKLSEAAMALKGFYLNAITVSRLVQGNSGRGFIDSILELVEPVNWLRQIQSFLDEIKPEIDSYFHSIKELPNYSYLFLTEAKFEEYLNAEPIYKSKEQNNTPNWIRKENLTLRSLSVENFRGIDRCNLSELPDTARWIVVTGRNGYGKTSLLQAIAAGLYGNFDESGRMLVPDSSRIKVSYVANGEQIKIESNPSRTSPSEKNLTNLLATYGSSRLQVTATVSQSAIESQSPTTYSLFNSDGLLLNVEQLLKDTNFYSPTFFYQLVELFKALIPQLADIQIAVVNRLPEVRYFEKDENGDPLTDGMTFSQLAAGFRNIIAMIGDMVYRLSTKQEVENLQNLQGIVIIDEFELHLHPVYQKQLPELLTTLFPHIQFIVSTHSPIPLLGIPKDVGVVLLHVTRTAKTGIVVERLDVDFSTLTPNAILSSPIFGFHDLIPDSKPDDQMVHTEDTFAEVVADEQMRKNISEFLTPERQQELLNLIQKK